MVSNTPLPASTLSDADRATRYRPIEGDGARRANAFGRRHVLRKDYVGLRVQAEHVDRARHRQLVAVAAAEQEVSRTRHSQRLSSRANCRSRRYSLDGAADQSSARPPASCACR